MSILELKEVRKSFGGVMAVAGLNLRVEDNRIQCIIGPNGAGKTTLFNLISGLYSCDEGLIFFKDRDITCLSPQEIVKMGIGRSFQVTNIFPKLTVFENIQSVILFTRRKGLSLFSDAKRLFVDDTKEIISMIGLNKKADKVSGILPAGDRKRLELGIVLATAPELLLLDEPTCGMSPMETADTIDLIKAIAVKRSLSVLFTEHKMDVVFGIASHITVMNFGSVIAAGKPEEIRADLKVQQIYFGEA
ncbi:MAG: ABC transporter ATP-binding protein [Desulfatiglans sp.]|jgi:branched-chain amino acid transport system ATP-binding protein|nr:ABC transporter ATP-binding protein [Thermodesulfobacteriota bacterium]MEE4353323.1 ABC transporter ATP-binding protein [Desulfatiglans sp.]